MFWHFSPLTGGCSEGLGAFWFFFKLHNIDLKADTSTFEYDRHRACLSVQTPTDEPSHVPLHARTLRGTALSSWWTSVSSLSAQAACRSFRGLMKAPNWYWRCTAYIFFVFKCVTVYLNWWKTVMRGYFLFTTVLIPCRVFVPTANVPT